MADKTYNMIESVGKGHQDIRSFEEIEKHHPTWKEDPKKRFYDELEGKREEFVFAPNGDKMLSKDIIFKVDGSNHVAVPSPFEGYAKLDVKWGTVNVYEHPDGKGNLIGRIRHMEPIQVKENQHIEYGQPLGIQGGKNGKDLSKPFGPHAHIDVSMSHLEQFKQFVKDVDSGVIAPGKYPAKEQTSSDMRYNGSQLELVSPQSSLTPRDTTHPNHELHTSIVGLVKDHEAKKGITWGEHSEKLCAALTVEACKARMTKVDELVQVGPMFHILQDVEPPKIAKVDSREAVQTPAEQNFDKLADLNVANDAYLHSQTQQFNRSRSHGGQSL